MINKISGDRIVTYLEKIALSAVIKDEQTDQTDRIYDYFMGAAKLIEKLETQLDGMTEQGREMELRAVKAEAQIELIQNCQRYRIDLHEYLDSSGDWMKALDVFAALKDSGVNNGS